MKTITTIAAALLITLSLNATAQDNKRKQEPVKKESKQEPVKTESRPQTSTGTPTAPKQAPQPQAEQPVQNTPQTKPVPSNLPGSNKRASAASRPMLKKESLKRSGANVPRKKVEAAPDKKMD